MIELFEFTLSKMEASRQAGRCDEFNQLASRFVVFLKMYESTGKFDEVGVSPAMRNELSQRYEAARRLPCPPRGTASETPVGGAAGDLSTPPTDEKTIEMQREVIRYVAFRLEEMEVLRIGEDALRSEPLRRMCPVSSMTIFRREL